MFDLIKKEQEMWKCGQFKNFAYLREYWTVSNDLWCAGIVEAREIRRDYVRCDAMTCGGNTMKISVDQAKFSDNLISSRVVLRFGCSWALWNRKNKGNLMQLRKM